MTTEQERGTEPIVITLGGVEYEATLPDYEASFELQIAWSANKIRGACALLGTCLPRLMPAGVTYEAHNYNAMHYGTVVWRELRKRGIEVGEIVGASTPLAIAVTRAAYPAGVEDRVLFTEAPEEAQTS